MDTIMQSLAGLDNFALYFGLSIVFLFIFKLVYALVTPHDEWKLVKEEKNVAAAIGFGGAIIGFAIALGSAASNSVAIIDFAIWAVFGGRNERFFEVFRCAQASDAKKVRMCF